MREFDRVKSHVAALQDLQVGTVDVYGFQAAAGSIVAPVMNELHQRHPNILFNFLASSTDETMEALTNVAAEVGLVLNPPVRDTVQNVEIYRDKIVAVFGPKHPLAGRKAVTLSEVAEFSMVLAVPSFGLRQQVERTFDRHAVRPNAFCVTNSISLMKDLASFGDQCTLLPRSAVVTEVGAGILVTVPVREFANDPMVFCVCLQKGRVPSPAARSKRIAGAMVLTRCQASPARRLRLGSRAKVRGCHGRACCPGLASVCPDRSLWWACCGSPEAGERWRWLCHQPPFEALRRSDGARAEC